MKQKIIISFFMLILTVNKNICLESITILGSGYVGLVTAVGFASLEHQVLSVDIDSKKVKSLANGIVTFYEPVLEELLHVVCAKKLLTFSNDIDHAVSINDIIFITVGTPLLDNGTTDISAIENLSRIIGKNLNRYKLIILKSTSPIGTISLIKKIFENEFNLTGNKDFDIVSCPEFLREGSAIHDFFNPSRLIWGIDSENPIPILRRLFEYFFKKQIPILVTSHDAAALIKYASNAFLATKISFINEIANLCDNIGINVIDVEKGLGLDQRIGASFLKPGPGFGGSCFPKDTIELCNIAKRYAIDLQIVSSTINVNENQLKQPFFKIKKLLNGNLHNKMIAIGGLSFKPGTDDIRCSPAITTIQLLTDAGACIKAYDPVANENMKKVFPAVNYCTTLTEALFESDGLIILTEWDEFKNMNLDEIGQIMKNKVIVDARNIFDPINLSQKNFCWANMGRSL